MSDSRKKIILNEILFWKQNKLLPEHYCDFLATLYAEGEDYEKQEDLSHRQAILSVERTKRILFSIGLMIVVLAVLYVLFSVDTMVWLISIVIAIIALAFLVGAFVLSKNKSLLAPIIHLVAALLILGVSIKISLTYFSENIMILYFLLLANCALWLFSGIKLKLTYFTVSGILGAIVMIGFSIYYYL